eukprot:2946482-Rhodomonas_salina.1
MRTIYFPHYHHPKELCIQNGVLNRELSKAVSRQFGSKETRDSDLGATMGGDSNSLQSRSSPQDRRPTRSGAPSSASGMAPRCVATRGSRAQKGGRVKEREAREHRAHTKNTETTHRENKDKTQRNRDNREKKQGAGLIKRRGRGCAGGEGEAVGHGVCEDVRRRVAAQGG